MNMKKTSGFTLVELLIVVIIMAVLSSIAYPLYTDQVRKARRYDAEGVLMALANVMEQDLARTPNTGYGISDLTPFSDLWTAIDNYYTFTVANPTAFSYTLTATPKSPQSGDACGTLSLTQNGTKSPADAGCWK